MSVAFFRTLRAFEGERRRPRWLAVGLAGLFLAGVIWLLYATVPVYEVTSHARLEVKNAAHPVAPQVAGQVVETSMVIGREVQAGDVLLVLDARAEELAYRERLARKEALTKRLLAVRRESRAEEEVLQLQTKARKLAHQESHAELEKARANVRFTQHQAEMMSQLRSRNAASELEDRRARAEAEAARAAAQSLELATSRQEQDRLALEGERRALLAKLDSQANELEGNLTTEAAAISRLQFDIDLRTIRAPVAGRIGEVAEVHVGSMVKQGDKLGSVVPPGQPWAVALFEPTVVGRIQRGQPARLRLAGFPWTQFGTMSATVADVAGELHDGQIRVELMLTPGSSPPIPLAHGMPGSVEVEVERVSPAVLVLRAAGQFLGTRRLTGADGTEAAAP
jgi:membrane fusion protein (multidrug efflux system)